MPSVDATSRPAPSGRAAELVAGQARATVVEVGGGLRTFTVAGRDILDGYGPAETCSAGRGQLLLPWPNRTAGGRYSFAGRTLQLDLSKPDEGNAIHGLTRWASWHLDQPAPDRVRATHLLYPKPGYPFTLACEADYRLAPDGLAVTTALTNLSDTPAPAGMGAHPYLAVAAPTVDGAVLRVPAVTYLLTDGRGIPTGPAPVAGTEFDFQQARPLGSTRLDTAFTDLVRDSDGLARVRLEAVDGVTTEVWADATWGYLQLFTADPLGGPARRRSVAVEPMTCAPDAFNNGGGLRILQPGERLEGTWGISVAAPGERRRDQP